jgi:late competence protein required for DNA uptake (superfamily II DNA/RNA helicase)
MQARDGVYVSLDEFVRHKGIEIKISDDGVVTIRARERSLAAVCESIDRRRESLVTAVSRSGKTEIVDETSVHSLRSWEPREAG